MHLRIFTLLFLQRRPDPLPLSNVMMDGAWRFYSICESRCHHLLVYAKINVRMIEYEVFRLLLRLLGVHGMVQCFHI